MYTVVIPHDEIVRELCKRTLRLCLADAREHAKADFIRTGNLWTAKLSDKARTKTCDETTGDQVHKTGNLQEPLAKGRFNLCIMDWAAAFKRLSRKPDYSCSRSNIELGDASTNRTFFYGELGFGVSCGLSRLLQLALQRLFS